MSRLVMHCELYGAPRWFCGAQEIEPPTVKARLLLAYLVLSGPRGVTRRALAELFWPEMEPARGLANLSTLLSRIRTALPAALREIFDVDAQTVRLRTELLTSDVAQVEQYLARVAGHRHRALVQCLRCAEDLRAAAELMRGPLLAGMHAYEQEALQHWLDGERERGQQRLIGVLEPLLAQAERMQDWPQLIRLGERLLQVEPWHERAVQQLMTAYACSGQRLTALQRYERFVEELAHEFACAPQAATRQLAADLGRDVTAVPSLPPLTVPAAERLYGRAAELAALLEAIGQPERRLVTICGLGGVGKTLLAQTAVRRLAPLYRDGAVFVALDGIEDAARVIPAIAQACGITLNGRQAALEETAEALSGRELILLLDNTEQIDGIDLVIHGLLTRTVQPVAVVTSRRPLQLWQETVITLHGFALDAGDDPAEDRQAALQLFSDRQQRSGLPAAAVDEPQALQICRAVGGIPLAIELAAQQLRSHSAAELLTWLAEDGNRLFSAAADLPVRQRSLQLIFAQAWQDLRAAQQQALADLTVISGQLQPATVAAVIGPQATDLLQVLVTRGLVMRQANGDALHPLVRQLVAQLQPPSPTAYRRHADYFLGRLAAADLHMIDGPSRQRAAGPAAEYDNLQRAWRRQAADDGEQLRGLIDSMLILLISQGWHALGAELFEATAAACSAIAAESLLAAATLRLGSGDFAATRRLARQAYRQPGGAAQRAAVINLRARVLHEEGRYRATARFAQYGERWAAATAVALRAQLQQTAARGLMFAGELAAADRQYDRALQLAEQSGNRGLIVDCLNSHAQIPARRGDLAGSLPLLETALTVTLQHGDVQAQITALVNVGAVRAVLRQDPAVAVMQLDQALDLARRLGNRRDLVSVLHSYAYGLIHLGRLAAALPLLQEGLAAALQIEHAPFVLEMLEGLGLLAAHQGEREHAQRLLAAVARHERTAPFVRQRAQQALQQFGLAAEPPAGLPADALMLGRQLPAELER
jgi:DNA-binding SARP family transcriptional activator/tetratricopeptide (TPR) repeat protein